MAKSKDVHDVNERIMNEIEKSIKEDNIRNFLKEILSFELDHFNEQSISRYKDNYKKILDKSLKK